MKYLKLENKWRILETGEEILIGGFVIEIYNYFMDTFREYIDKSIDSPSEIDWTEEYFFAPINNRIDKFGYEYMIMVEFMYILENHLLNSQKNTKINTEEIERIKANGWYNISQYANVEKLDIYQLTHWKMDLRTIEVTHHLYNNKWYPAYEVSEQNEGIIAMLDLQEVRNHNYLFCKCKHCYKLFIQKDGRNKYCETCSKNYKKIADQKRRNTPRGKHKIVCNYLRNAGCFSDIEIGDFMRESNYYWDNLHDKSVEKEKTFTSNISTEEEYVSWLEKCHKDFKAEAKQRKHT